MSTIEYINGTWLENTANWALSRSELPPGTEKSRVRFLWIGLNIRGSHYA